MNVWDEGKVYKGRGYQTDPNVRAAKSRLRKERHDAGLLVGAVLAASLIDSPD